MSVISTRTKGKAGIKAAKAAAKRPKLVLKGTKAAGKTWAKTLKIGAKRPKLMLKGAKAAVPAGKAGVKAGKPVIKRRARQRVDQIDRAARTVGEVLVVYGPWAAYEFGLVEPPKQKRTAPRVITGVVVGATAMYFLEPGQGQEHRQKVAQFVS